MKKWGSKIILLVIILFIIFIVYQVATPNLIRVNVQEFSAEGTEDVNSEVIISEDKKLNELENLINNIEWEENSNNNLNDTKFVKATFFYEHDKNKPELLVEYNIFFDERDNSILVHDKDSKKYGIVDKTNAIKFKKIISISKN